MTTPPDERRKPDTSGSVATDATDPGGEEIEMPRGFDRGLAILCLVLMGAVVLTVLLQVGMRYVFNAPLSWTDELARYQLVWLTFLGAALAYRLGLHIAVDAAAEMLRARQLSRLGDALNSIVHGVTFVVAVVLLLSGYDLVASTWSRTTPALGLPMGAVYLAVPLAGVIIVTSAVHRLALELRRRSRPGDDR